MVALTGNRDGTQRHRLHGQPRHRLSRASPARAGSACRSTACCRPGTSPPGSTPRSACSPPSATAPAPARARWSGSRCPTSPSRITAGLGRLAQGELGLDDGGKGGNDLYGAFGRDFATRDGRAGHGRGADARSSGRPSRTRPASTPRWRRSPRAPASTSTPRAAATRRATTSPRCSSRGSRRAALPRSTTAFSGTGVSWGPLPDLRPARDRGPARRRRQPDVRHGRPRPAAAAYRTPASPLDFSSIARLPPLPAPALGQHTDEILAGVLGLPDHEIGRLHDKGIVAGPK